jgi:hypothetical protein
MADQTVTQGGGTIPPWVTIDRITRHTGIAGQYSLEVAVTYWHGGDTVAERNRNADPTITTFTGSVYGAPVVMTTFNGEQCFVSDWRQYGPRLDNDWVWNFYGIGGLA